jgi:Flp pilus assembly secretin CpaC
MNRRSLLLAAGLTLAGGFAGGAAFAQEPIFVTVDQARVMQISRPADTVIIGNPAIADAVIRDSQTLVITGRSYGTTNLIVLDTDGQPIADELLTVQAADDYLVTVYVGGKRATYSCTPACQPTIAVGDDLEVFDARVGQVTGAAGLSR